jgi:hypothetical protein
VASADAITWKGCETTCQTTLGGGANAAQSCVFYTLSTYQQDKDSTQQQYAVVFDTSDVNRTSYVQATTSRVYTAQVAVGWNDDGSATAPYQHRVTFRTNLFRNSP